MKMIESGREPPDAYFDQPEMPSDVLFYWIAFHELSSERQIGMAVGPIPRSQIRAYADEQKMGVDEFDRLYRIIRAVDDKYLEQINATDKKDGHVPIDNVEATKLVIQRAGQAMTKKAKPNG